MQSLARVRSTETANPRQIHLAYADALRATAIFVVVLHHLVYLTRPAIGHHRPYEFGYLGVWGVNCFFVLSGYLLGRPYVAALLDPSRAMPSTRLFFARRFLRIYPLYAVAILLSIVLVFVTYRSLPSIADIASHVFMLHTLFPEFATSLNGPLWTMSVDAEFYVALPLAAAAFAAILTGRTSAFRIRAVLVALAVVVAFSLVFRFEILAQFPETAHNFSLAVVLMRNLFGFSGTFAFGIFLATIALLFRDRIPQRPVLFSALVVVGLVLAAVQLGIRSEPKPGPPNFTTLARLTLNEFGAALSVSLIFFGLSEGRLPGLTAFTQKKIVTSLAALSYSVYLVHWPIIDGISVALGRPQGFDALFRLGAISVPIVFLLALVLHRFIERPILRVKDGMREGDSARTIANAAATRPTA